MRQAGRQNCRAKQRGPPPLPITPPLLSRGPFPRVAASTPTPGGTSSTAETGGAIPAEAATRGARMSPPCSKGEEDGGGGKHAALPFFEIGTPESGPRPAGGAVGPPPALQNNTRHPTAAPGAMNPEARTSVGGGSRLTSAGVGGGGPSPPRRTHAQTGALRTGARLRPAAVRATLPRRRRARAARRGRCGEWRRHCVPAGRHGGRERPGGGGAHPQHPA